MATLALGLLSVGKEVLMKACRSLSEEKKISAKTDSNDQMIRVFWQDVASGKTSTKESESLEDFRNSICHIPNCMCIFQKIKDFVKPSMKPWATLMSFTNKYIIKQHNIS